MDSNQEWAYETEIEKIRQKHYNATVVRLRLIHDDLLIIRVRPDKGIPQFKPGQYTTLGLGSWERRIDSTGASEHPDKVQLIRRAYSISCTLVDTAGELKPCETCNYLEFYITLVPRPDDEKPPLTPRLFALTVDSRIHIGPKPVGTYTLEHVGEQDDIIFAGTGTGEAPHNSMAAELLRDNHHGRIAMLTCVRHKSDAAYVAEHEQLAKKYPNYQYRLYTTREPENVDKSHPEYIGKQYLQHIFSGTQFEKDFGWKPNPAATHVYLCGNPDMIGLPYKDADENTVFPETTGVVEILTLNGFKLDAPRNPGNIHFEKYW